MHACIWVCPYACICLCVIQKRLWQKHIEVAISDIQKLENARTKAASAPSLAPSSRSKSTIDTSSLFKCYFHSSQSITMLYTDTDAYLVIPLMHMPTLNCQPLRKHTRTHKWCNCIIIIIIIDPFHTFIFHSTFILLFE